jgi:hypothetical protein
MATESVGGSGSANAEVRLELQSDLSRLLKNGAQGRRVALTPL